MITIFINERSINDREQCNPFDKLTLQFIWLSFSLPPCWINIVRTVWLVYLHIFLMGIHNEINILVFINCNTYYSYECHAFWKSWEDSLPKGQSITSKRDIFTRCFIDTWFRIRALVCCNGGVSRLV